MLQGGGAPDVQAPAEGAAGPPAEAPLAPYVPLMATDAVADAAAALLLDDVVPVQEESTAVVESISSNAGQRPDRQGATCSHHWAASGPECMTEIFAVYLATLQNIDRISCAAECSAHSTALPGAEKLRSRHKI